MNIITQKLISTIYEEIYKLQRIKPPPSHNNPNLYIFTGKKDHLSACPFIRRCKDVAIITSLDWPLSLHPSRKGVIVTTPHWKTHRISTGTSGASFKLQNRGDEATLYAEIPLNCKRPFSKVEGREGERQKGRSSSLSSNRNG